MEGPWEEAIVYSNNAALNIDTTSLKSNVAMTVASTLPVKSSVKQFLDRVSCSAKSRCVSKWSRDRQEEKKI